MPQQARRIVYFLGAGASLGAGAVATVEGGGRIRILTQGTFWDTFLRFSRGQNNRKTIESFLFRYFHGYSRTPARWSAVQKRKALANIDVEEVFTFLSERINAPETFPQQRTELEKVWNALLAEFVNVFRRFPANTKTRGIYRHFFERHVRSRDTVVSFNYDTVFERSLRPATSWYYAGIELTHESGALRIIKPHGSINWHDDGHIRIINNPDRPVIVAPTHLKFVALARSANQEQEDDGEEIGEMENENGPIGYMNQSIQLASVWAEMERQMRAAKHLSLLDTRFHKQIYIFPQYSGLYSLLAIPIRFLFS